MTLKPLNLNDKIKESVHGKTFNHTVINVIPESDINPLMYVTRFYVRSKNRWCYELLYHWSVEFFINAKSNRYKIVRRRKNK